MLKVAIEVHPGGDSKRAKTIAWAEIFNIDDHPDKETASYQFVLYEGERGEGKVRAQGNARNVAKSKGVWFIVFRCLFSGLIGFGGLGGRHKKC